MEIITDCENYKECMKHNQRLVLRCGLAGVVWYPDAG